jgi:hypothetical protein
LEFDARCQFDEAPLFESHGRMLAPLGIRTLQDFSRRI